MKNKAGLSKLAPGSGKYRGILPHNSFSTQTGVITPARGSRKAKPIAKK